MFHGGVAGDDLGIAGRDEETIGLMAVEPFASFRIEERDADMRL